VADLCQNMAIIVGGRIVAQGQPLAMIENMRGRIWRKMVDKAAVADHQARYNVISTRLFAGRSVVHAVADSDPGDGFEPVAGGLEDVYFSTLRTSRAAA